MAGTALAAEGLTTDPHETTDVWYPTIFLIFFIYGIAEIYIINRENCRKRKKKTVLSTVKKAVAKRKNGKK